jgi:hypothetical protein
MITTIVILSLLCLTLAFFIYVSVKRNLEYQDKMQEIVDQTEVALDVLNTCYQRAAARAELEVMSDEPVVRELVQDIKMSRDAILLVANLIVEPIQDDEEGNK